jgi:hypothetical protein
MNSYESVEGRLGEFLRVVPYCDAHLDVWSPDLVTVMLEAGSQLDALWRDQARLSKYTTPKPDMVDYFTYLGSHLHFRWIVFWGDEPTKLYPFPTWAAKSSFKRNDYAPLPWWSAFTALKHDRLSERTQATLQHSVAAVAALFLAIINCDECRDEIVQAKWLSGLYPNPAAWLRESESTVTFQQWITVESTLFTYPVGWCKRAIAKGSNWDNDRASHRFQRWYSDCEQPATT